MRYDVPDTSDLFEETRSDFQEFWESVKVSERQDDELFWRTLLVVCGFIAGMAAYWVVTGGTDGF